MTIPILRTADAWWAITPAGTVRQVETTAITTADLLADRAALVAARDNDGTTDVADLDLISPVTAPCRVVAQMTNYVSHVQDTGMNPERVPLTLFRKASGSICGPYDDIVRPAHVKFLDYEVEIGLVVGDPLEVGETVTPSSWQRHIAALVVTNDVSARDVQLPKTQFYEAKSYPTFTPVGPVLLVLEDGDLDRFGDLRLQLKVNGESRQDSTVADMIYQPVQALQTLSKFQRLDTGDLILTGTPGGTALKAPPKPMAIIASLLPPTVRWKAFFKSQVKNTSYLQDGDVVEVAVATPDGDLQLGEQRNTVRFSR